MKNWKCPQCANQHQTEDDIVFVVCKHCLSEMKIFPFAYEREVEDGK